MSNSTLSPNMALAVFGGVMNRVTIISCYRVPFFLNNLFPTTYCSHTKHTMLARSGKNWLPGSLATDNFVFKLHYRWTVLVLVVFSFVITCRLSYGYSFVCHSRHDQLSWNYLQVFCYANSVFTVPSEWNKHVGTEVIYPGISTINSNQQYYYYYSWVNLVLLVQAFIFYLPHLLWRIYEKGYVKNLTTPLSDVFYDPDKRNVSLCVLAKYVLQTQGKHACYTCIYILCEALNFLFIILQIVWLVDFFQVTGLHHVFLKEEQSFTWLDFESFYFPSIGKCQYFSYGSSGDIQKQDAICNLPLNKMYMYMFLFLNAWYIFLAVLSGLTLVYRTAIILPVFRSTLLKLKAPLLQMSTLQSFCNKASISDWFFLSHLQKNMLDTNFTDLVNKLGVVSQYCGNTEDTGYSADEPVKDSAMTPM